MAGNSSGKWIDLIKKFLELIVAGIALLAAIVGSFNSSSKIAKQQEEIHKHEQEIVAQQKSISRLESCFGEVTINISNPKDNDEVLS